MTKDELIARIARKKTKGVELTWAQFTSAVGSAGQEAKAALLDAVNKDDASRIATAIASIVVSKRRDIVKPEIDQIIANDSLTLDQISELLG